MPHLTKVILAFIVQQTALFATIVTFQDFTQGLVPASEWGRTYPDTPNIRLQFNVGTTNVGTVGALQSALYNPPSGPNGGTILVLQGLNSAGVIFYGFDISAPLLPTGQSTQAGYIQVFVHNPAWLSPQYPQYQAFFETNVVVQGNLVRHIGFSTPLIGQAISLTIDYVDNPIVPIGLSNVAYDEITFVPEPSTFMMVSGLSILAILWHCLGRVRTKAILG